MWYNAIGHGVYTPVFLASLVPQTSSCHLNNWCPRKDLNLHQVAYETTSHPTGWGLVQSNGVTQLDGGLLRFSIARMVLYVST